MALTYRTSYWPLTTAGAAHDGINWRTVSYIYHSKLFVFSVGLTVGTTVVALKKGAHLQSQLLAGPCVAAIHNGIN
jgi:hypothetical protein